MGSSIAVTKPKQWTYYTNMMVIKSHMLWYRKIDSRTLHKTNTRAREMKSEKNAKPLFIFIAFHFNLIYLNHLNSCIQTAFFTLFDHVVCNAIATIVFIVWFLLQPLRPNKYVRFVAWFYCLHFWNVCRQTSLAHIYSNNISSFLAAFVFYIAKKKKKKWRKNLQESSEVRTSRLVEQFLNYLKFVCVYFLFFFVVCMLFYIK